MKRTVLAVLLLAAVIGPAGAGEWASWRGPRHDGTSDAKGLVSSWSTSGENLIWKAELIGRSTPVVFDGRVCVMGRVDPAKNRKVRLTDKECRILKYLLRANAAPVNRATLLADVWGFNSGVTTHTLETHIYRLRQKMEADPANPQLLLTDRGAYRLEPRAGERLAA